MNTMNMKWYFMATACAIGVTLSPGLAAAELAAADSTPVAESGTQLKTIVVTAQKRRENINDVGLSITAASGD
jgi:iron complex outermembrane recepter protein